MCILCKHLLLHVPCIVYHYIECNTNTDIPKFHLWPERERFTITELFWPKYSSQTEGRRLSSQGKCCIMEEPLKSYDTHRQNCRWKDSTQQTTHNCAEKGVTQPPSWAWPWADALSAFWTELQLRWKEKTHIRVGRWWVHTCLQEAPENTALLQKALEENLWQNSSPDHKETI